MPGKRWTGRWKECRHCGNGFWCSPCHDEGGSLHLKKYCSRACYFAHRATAEGIKERFWEYVNKTDGCWLFGGCIGHEGYGSFAYGHRNGRRQFQAHRFSWLITNGEIPDDKLVLHKCDVRQCVNPEHLYLGDRLDNARDCLERGRRNNRYTPVDKLLFPHLSQRGQLTKKRAQSSAAKES